MKKFRIVKADAKINKRIEDIESGDVEFTLTFKNYCDYSECYELIKEFDSLEDAEIDWENYKNSMSIDGYESGVKNVEEFALIECDEEVIKEFHWFSRPQFTPYFNYYENDEHMEIELGTFSNYIEANKAVSDFKIKLENKENDGIDITFVDYYIKCGHGKIK